MSGLIFGEDKNFKMLLKNLMDSVKECQNIYGKNKTLLATEKDIRVQRLCTNWESALSHGLKTTSVFKNIVSGNLTTEVPSTSFWDFARNHLTSHEKERFSTLRYVYTNHGKVRALIRAALNERALERYILTWLGDINGLNTHFESWALIRDNEASNLLPSIAAGLGSILFAITVDCSELNVASTAETVSPRQTNEIIIAVPSVSSTSERKATSSKRPQIISFEDDDSVINNNVLRSSTPPIASVSLSDACLKYDNKTILNKTTFESDSTYERVMKSSDPIESTNINERNETEYIEPESPTEIKIFNTITEPYPPLSISYESKETDSTISKVTDSSSVTSSATTNSSTSAKNPISSQPSTSDSMHSSISRSSENVSEAADSGSNIEHEQMIRIHELEQRCASLEEKVTALTLENSRLKSVHHNLVMSRQSLRHFSVSIPRVSLQRKENSNRKYFAYEIQIVPISGGEDQKWSLLRRYSEFHRLHKYLQKDNAMIRTLDFPPKKSFGNMNAEFVELRRQRLQVYLLGVLSLMPELSKCNTRSQIEQAFPFFQQNHQL